MRLPNARPLSLALAVGAAFLVSVDSARAVVDLGGSDQNRRIRSLTTAPSKSGPAGTHDVLVTWSFEFNGDATEENLSTGATISLSRGGKRVEAPDDLSWDIRDAYSLVCDGSSCGTVMVDGKEHELTCDTSDSRCHGPELTGVFRGVVLDAETQITVTLVAVSEAPLDSDSSDDSKTIVFESKSASAGNAGATHGEGHTP